MSLHLLRGIAIVGIHIVVIVCWQPRNVSLCSDSTSRPSLLSPKKAKIEPQNSNKYLLGLSYACLLAEASGAWRLRSAVDLAGVWPEPEAAAPPPWPKMKLLITPQRTVMGVNNSQM